MAKNRKLSNPTKESIYHVQNELLKQGRIKTYIIDNLVDVVSYCKNYCRIKGIEYDENEAGEILTVSKKQLITYGKDKDGKPIIIKSE